MTQARPGRLFSRPHHNLSTRQIPGAGGIQLLFRAIFLTATLAGALVGALAGCARSSPPIGLARLHPCAGSEGPTDASCGNLQVYENRAAGTGRRISLNIVALPSLAGEPASDPLFFLAGGPGQAAAQMAAQVREIFRPVLRHRDIILVDQRGTGKSNPLDCRSESNTLQELTEPDTDSLGRL